MSGLSISTCARDMASEVWRLKSEPYRPFCHVQSVSTLIITVHLEGSSRADGVHSTYCAHLAQEQFDSQSIPDTTNTQMLLPRPDTVSASTMSGLFRHISTSGRDPEEPRFCHRSSAGRVKMMATSQTRCVLSDLSGGSGQPSVHVRGRIQHSIEGRTRVAN